MEKKISLTVPESVSKRIPHVSVPEFNLPKFTPPDINVPKVTIPDEARRPFYAAVGAADVAVELFRDALATVQIRVVHTQKSLSDTATSKLGDNMSTASSAYAEFTRRGEETIGRIWPDAVAKTAPAPAKATKPKATTKAAPKKRTAPKAAAPKAAPKATAPKAGAPRVAAPKAAAPEPAEAKSADEPTSE